MEVTVELQLMELVAQVAVVMGLPGTQRRVLQTLEEVVDQELDGRTHSLVVLAVQA